MREKRSYTKEFKENAVQLVLSGRGATEVSRDLGINVSLLNHWRRLYLKKQDQAHDGVGCSPSELAAENKQLRKELAEQV